MALSKGSSAKQATSLPELVRDSNNFSVKNRAGCQPALDRSSPRSLRLEYNVKCNLETSDPNGHDVKVQFDVEEVRDEITAKNLDVAVTCSCPAFLYWGGQWNAHSRDALEGEPRPLLTAPTERLDLREDFVICKHIKAVADRILPSVQYNINKILEKRRVEQSRREEELDRQTNGKDPSRLEQRQQEMRDRLDRKRRNQRDQKDVRRKLEEGLRKRDQIDDVVKRDTPATPEEKERVPVLAPEAVPAPDAHAEHVHPPAVDDDIPTIPGLEVDPLPTSPPPSPPPPPKPAPAKPAPAASPEKIKAPQRTPPKPEMRRPMTDMPAMSPRDREQVQKMLREEQKRQNRQTEQRRQNNPGNRR